MRNMSLIQVVNSRNFYLESLLESNIKLFLKFHLIIYDCLWNLYIYLKKNKKNVEGLFFFFKIWMENICKWKSQVLIADYLFKRQHSMVLFQHGGHRNINGLIQRYLIFEDNYKKCDGKLYYISYNNNVDVLIN